MLSWGNSKLETENSELNLTGPIGDAVRASRLLVLASMMPESQVDFRPRSFAFACDIVRLYKSLMKTAPHHIARQVLKSGTSIGANLEEAKPAESRKDLISKFSIALKEARETQYWLRLIIATELADPAVITAPLQEATEFVAILTASVRSLKGQTKGN